MFTNNLQHMSCISGGGTTCLEILNAIRKKRLSGVDLACVIASTAKSDGIQKLKDAGYPENRIIVIDSKDDPDSEAFGDRILAVCKRFGVDSISQNGLVSLMPINVIDAYENWMINQHPGPPEFGGRWFIGRRVHFVRLEFEIVHGWRNPWTEVIAQRVDPEFDKGMVVGRRSVQMFDDDTPEALQERALPLEHKLQIQVIQQLADGTLQEVLPVRKYVQEDEKYLLGELIQQARRKYPKF